MDKEALAKFKTVFKEFDAGRLDSGNQEIVLKNGGLLNIIGRGGDMTALISLPRGVKFEVEKVGEILEVWIQDGVELRAFKLYVRKGKAQNAPNGWVVSTIHGDVITLGIS